MGEVYARLTRKLHQRARDADAAEAALDLLECEARRMAAYIERHGDRQAKGAVQELHRVLSRVASVVAKIRMRT